MVIPQFLRFLVVTKTKDNMTLRGYDIDGVLTAGVKPQGDYVVISGRLRSSWSNTVKEIGTTAPIYLRPFGEYDDHYAAGKWKGMLIEYLGVGVFYEDVPLQASIIKTISPKCKVILVVDGVPQE